MKTSLSVNHSQAFEAFRYQLARAQRRNAFARLFGKSESNSLTSPKTMPQRRNRKYLGLQDIPVEQIRGSLNRNHDFDSTFRPLRDHLRERWINAYLHRDVNNWPPVKLHKVDENYFVEDGHHRVSIAHCTGILFIQAEVWSYETPDNSPSTTTTIIRAPLNLKNSACICATGVEVQS